MDTTTIPNEVKDAYSHLGDIKSIITIEKGLINKTFLVDSYNGKYILQEVSAIFDEGIHYDSEAVCEHLARFSVEVPAIKRNRFGALFSRSNGRIFRALNYVEGESFHQINSLHMAFESGRVVGQFHKSLIDFSYAYRSHRRHKGDYPFHVENLLQALRTHSQHDYYSTVKPLAEKMLGHMGNYCTSIKTTPRHAHGDPKISNILFKGEQALCLIDFDTLGMSGWSLEMGDALRSWCNRQEEDVLDAYVDLEIAQKALQGYASMMKGLWSESEKRELVLHCQAVSLCLAIRYLTDVLNESYFGFSRRFSRAAEHNWLRSQAMYRLFEDFLRQQNKIETMVFDII